MTDDKKNPTLAELIDQAKKLFGKIPEDQQEARECVHLLITVVNTYAQMHVDMQKEFVKMKNIIDTQNETLQKKFKKGRIIV